jgi:hypothetical protein
MKLLAYVGAVVLINVAADVASLPLGKWVAVLGLHSAAFLLLVWAFGRQPRDEESER